MVRTLKPLAVFVQAVQVIPLLTISIVSLAPVAALSQDRHCPTPAVVVQHPQPGDQGPIKIRRVEFTGSPALSSQEQEEVSAALSKDAFNYKSLQDDRNVLKARVRQMWQQRGYFRVAVAEPDLKPDVTDPSAFIATIHIDAGKQYRVAELRFVKNTVFPSETLRSLFPMQTGDIFNTQLAGKGMEEIRKLYGESGYINLVIVPTTQVEKGADQVDLTLELDEGQQFRVGKVEVLSADEARRRQLILESGLITGKVFNASMVQKAFASGTSDGSEAMAEFVNRKINDADGTIDFKIDLEPCVAKSQ
jgi:outer membrane protein assembly factor BamA